MKVITLTWEYVDVDGEIVTGFTIKRDGVVVATDVGADLRTYHDDVSTLTDLDRIRYDVQAQAADGTLSDIVVFTEVSLLHSLLPLRTDNLVPFGRMYSWATYLGKKYFYTENKYWLQHDFSTNFWLASSPGNKSWFWFFHDGSAIPPITTYDCYVAYDTHMDLNPVKFRVRSDRVLPYTLTIYGADSIDGVQTELGSMSITETNLVLPIDHDVLIDNSQYNVQTFTTYIIKVAFDTASIVDYPDDAWQGYGPYNIQLLGL